jgi:hypothetical protein
MAVELYKDPLVTITDDGIVVHHYGLLGDSKHVRWANVEHVKALQPTLWNGRWRLHGTASFTTWFASDWARPTRETIFHMKLRSQAVKVGFTVHDAGRVKQVLADRHVLINEQGEARPTPLPAETRPLVRWPEVHAMAAVVLVLFAQAVYYFPQLPARVATHFNFSGHADGWGARGSFVGTMVVLTTIFAAGSIAGAYVLSRTAAGVVGRYVAWIGIATVLMMTAISNLSFRANLSSPQAMGAAPLYVMLAYFAALGVVVFLLLRRLARA